MSVATPEPAADLGSVDFALTPEQRAVEQAARDFAAKEIDPIVEEIDEAQRFPREVFSHLGELGFLGVVIPEEYGGAGMGYVEYVLVVREISRVDPSIGLSVAAHNSLCTNHIFKFGSEEQKRRWVVPLAKGEKIGAWSLTEPGAGSDAAGTRTRAERVDGGWVLNGAKTFTTHGSVGDVCVVMAVDEALGEAAEQRHHKISAFVLERGMDGFRAGKKENKLGCRASDTSEVVMEDCFVPEDHLLGEPGTGFKQALAILDGGRISIAALSLGMAHGAFDTAARLRQGAPPVRQGDRRVPGDRLQPGGDGHPHRRRRGAHPARRAADGPLAGASPASPPRPSSTPRRPRSTAPSAASRSTAATASSRTTGRRSTTAIRRSARSARAPARSSAW